VDGTHDGALPQERPSFEPDLADHETRHVDEKQQIARAALDELPEEGAVLLDACSTTAHLARLIQDDRQLTVVTNGLTVALMLAEHRNITVLLIGGRIDRRTMTAIDGWAERALDDIFVDVAFIGANGVSVARGLTTPDPTEAIAKRAMIAAARRTVVLADHTKFEADHLEQFGELADVDVLITDSQLDPGLVVDIENAGPRMVQA
jgi:DeoR family fructose operon transcriptional repressor